VERRTALPAVVKLKEFTALEQEPAALLSRAVQTEGQAQRFVGRVGFSILDMRGAGELVGHRAQAWRRTQLIEEQPHMAAVVPILATVDRVAKGMIAPVLGAAEHGADAVQPTLIEIERGDPAVPGSGHE